MRSFSSFGTRANEARGNVKSFDLDFSDDDEDRNRIAAAAKARGGEYLECPLDGPEIVVVGDTPRDVACGRHIGARTLAVATGGATLEALQACEPDWAVADLTHLSAAEICGG